MNKTLEDLIKKNFWIKVFSIAFAIIIWAYVVGGKKQDVSYIAGLKIYSLPKGYAISNSLPKKIHIKLRGSRISMVKLQKNIVFMINGSSLLGRKNTVILNDSYLNLPQNVEVISIYPKIVPVVISRIVTRYIAVLPITTGHLWGGYKLEKISVFPRFVKVEGPKDIVDHLDVITTEDIDLNNYRKGMMLSVNLKKPTKKIKILYNKKINISISAVKTNKSH